MSGACGPAILVKNQCNVIVGAHAMHHDGHPTAILHWFLTRMAGVEGFPDVCCHAHWRT